MLIWPQEVTRWLTGWLAISGLGTFPNVRDCRTDSHMVWGRPSLLGQSTMNCHYIDSGFLRLRGIESFH